MKSFLSLAAMAALAAHVNAVCDIDTADNECSDFLEVDAMVAANSGNYTWKFTNIVNDAGYDIKLFSFIADSSGNLIDDQWTKDAVLMIPPAR